MNWWLSLVAAALLYIPPALPSAGRLEELREAQRVLRNGDFREAAARLNDLKQRRPADVHVSYLLGSIAFFENEPARAATTLEQAAQQAPRQARIHFRLYEVLQKSGRREAALEALEKAVNLQPLVWTWHDRLASEYILRSRYDQAEQQFLRLLQAQPDSVETRLNLAFLLFAQQRPEFVAEIQKAFQADSTLADTYFYEIFAWNMQPENLAETLIAILRTAAVGSEQVHLHLGKAYLNLQRYGLAHDELVRHLQTHPQDREARRLQALTLALDGRWREAGAAYQQLFEQGDQEEQVVYGLADALLEQNQPERALEVLSPLLEASEVRLKVNFLQGRILEKLGRLDEALQAFDKVLSADPDFLEAYYQQGQIWARKRDTGKARERLELYRKMEMLQENRAVMSLIDLPAAALGAPYQEPLGSGGSRTAGYRWKIVDGRLPPGLSFAAEPCAGLSCSGVLQGTPSEDGEFVFSVEVQNLEGESARMTFSLLVYPAP